MPKTNLVYLDNAATTEVDEHVLEKYNEVAIKYFANTSSIHGLGQEAFNLLEKARKQIIKAFDLENTHEVVFTSGATEANNLAIKGAAFEYSNRGKHIIVSEVEHPSVLEVAKQLKESFGFDVEYLPVASNGAVSVEKLKSMLRDDTILVSIMAVNNEIGSINPIEEIGRLLKSYPKVLFHVDATQAVGKINISYKDVDMFSFSGHKIHALHNSGCLIKRKTIKLLPLLAGGGQENFLRSGTVDLPNAVALAVAIKKANDDLNANLRKISTFYSQIAVYLKDNEDLYELNSSFGENPYILNFSLKNKKASVVVEALSNRDVMVSSTSACHSKREAFSYVVKALKKDSTLYLNTIRVSFSKNNSEEDVTQFIKNLDEIMKEVKSR